MRVGEGVDGPPPKKIVKVLDSGIFVVSRKTRCRKYTPSTRDTYPFLNPYPHVNTVTMSELITTSSAYIINGDSPMTSVANTVAMTTFAVHTLQPLIFYRLWAHSPRRNWSETPSLTLLTFAAWLGKHTSRMEHPINLLAYPSKC